MGVYGVAEVTHDFALSVLKIAGLSQELASTDGLDVIGRGSGSSGINSDPPVSP